jgi:hemolysin III
MNSWFQEVRDSGPIYKETIMNRFPVEPFNTVSNLIFLATIIYFSYLIYKSDKNHYFLKACMPIYFVGFVGGTIYHATRSAEIWLLMDWVPIVLLCLACSIYFIARAHTDWWKKLIVVGVIILLNVMPRVVEFPQGFSTSMGYIGTAAAVVLPVALYGRFTKWRNFKFILFAVLCFIAAVSFRTLDRFNDIEFLYMGTHWLWHTMGGVAVFFLMTFIYRDNENYDRNWKLEGANFI